MECTRITRPQYLQGLERRRWAAIQKQERGLYLIDAEVKDQMRSNGVVPDILGVATRWDLRRWFQMLRPILPQRSRRRCES